MHLWEKRRARLLKKLRPGAKDVAGLIADVYECDRVIELMGGEERRDPPLFFLKLMLFAAVTLIIIGLAGLLSVYVGGIKER